MTMLVFAYKGGEGSGNFQHAGRPGEVGGSQAGGDAPDSVSYAEHGLYAIPTFTGGKAVILPDGTILKNNVGTRSHTQIYARMILSDPGGYNQNDVDLANRVISQDMEEYAPLERVVMEKGSLSIEVDFMGGLTVVGTDGNRHADDAAINSIFRKIVRAMDRGHINVLSADRLAIHFNGTFAAVPFLDIDMISRFTVNEFGKAIAHYKECTKLTFTYKGGDGHAGISGKVKPKKVTQQ